MKFIWPKIIKVIKKRQQEVYDSLILVKEAKEKVHKINSKNLLKIRATKKKCSQIIQNALEKKHFIIENAKKKAFFEQKKMLEEAKLSISFNKIKVKNELKKKAVLLAIKIAKKILNKEVQKSDYLNKSIKQFIVDFKGA
jgi:F-type H+-transporting ATPase subunit b